jgi:hypothetical protein
MKEGNMEGNAVLTLLHTDRLENTEHVELAQHLTELVGPAHLPAAWVAANEALNAGAGSGDWARSIEVRPAAWFTARQVADGLDLERFCTSGHHSLAV